MNLKIHPAVPRRDDAAAVGVSPIPLPRSPAAANATTWLRSKLPRPLSKKHETQTHEKEQRASDQRSGSHHWSTPMINFTGGWISLAEMELRDEFWFMRGLGRGLAIGFACGAFAGVLSMVLVIQGGAP